MAIICVLRSRGRGLYGTANRLRYVMNAPRKRDWPWQYPSEAFAREFIRLYKQESGLK